MVDFYRIFESAAVLEHQYVAKLDTVRGTTCPALGAGEKEDEAPFPPKISKITASKEEEGDDGQIR